MTILGDSTDQSESQASSNIIKAHERSIVGVSFIKDSVSKSSYLVTCAHDSLKFWTVDDSNAFYEFYQEIKGWRNAVQAFDITSDGSIAVIVGVDSTLHQIIISVSEKDFSIDSFNIGHMEIWHICITSYQEYLSVSFSGSLNRLDRSGKIVESVSFDGVRRVTYLCLSPNGKLLAVANSDGVVYIVDTSSLATLFFFEAHAIKIRAVCFLPRSDHLLTGSDDKIIKLYSITRNESQLTKVFCGHQKPITALKFKHGKNQRIFASCSNDSTVIIWDVACSHPIHIFEEAHDGVVSSLTFSPNNQYIISVGEDRTICTHALTKELTEESDSKDEEPKLDFYSAAVQYHPDNIPIDDYASSLNGMQAGYSKKDDEEDELMAIARRDLED